MTIPPSDEVLRSEAAMVDRRISRADHDCSPATGDHWLAAHVPGWLRRRAEVFITFDTGNPDNTHGGGHVYAVLAGHGVRRGVDPRFMNHYSALAGIERAFGLPLLGAAHAATPVPF
jgi:hypothetical protein